MHELSIANEIVGIVNQYLPDTCQKVNSVKIRIGKLTNVLSDSLQFCFSVITGNSNLEDAELDIEVVEVTAECLACKKIFRVIDNNFNCSVCSCSEVKILTGTELNVVEILVDE